MATRFDRAGPQNRSRPAGEPQPLRREQSAPPVSVAATSPSPVGAAEVRVLPVRPLAAAVSCWLAMVFLACHLALPVAFSAAGLGAGMAAYTVAAVPAFGFASFVALIGVLAARPLVSTTRAAADPVLAAVLGALGAWVLVQNSMPGLLPPFSAMSGAQVAAQVAVNGLEASLLGVMFASFTRRPAVAFALGAAFELVLLGVALTVLRYLALVA
jgi:energy-converting hydrogenase Eha subunit B